MQFLYNIKKCVEKIIKYGVNYRPFFIFEILIELLILNKTNALLLNE